MKWKQLFCLILAVLLLSSCALVTDGVTTAPTTNQVAPSLAAYTVWLGHPA